MKIVVSLTSWSKRIEQARATVDDLLVQTRKPESIELNLDLENFPHGFMDTPKWVSEYVDRFDNFHVYFAEKDLKVYSKIMPTIWRHKEELDDLIIITCDDDNNYPPTYVEEIESNMKGYDWLCSQHDKLTQGQFMCYSGRALKAFFIEINKEFMDNVPLDDLGLFWIMQKYKLRRGRKIAAKCTDRQAGYSFRRFFIEYDDVSKLQDTTCEYPLDEFVTETAYLRKIGIVK